jgi:DNA-binding transcriptional LysR family regulator
MNKHPTVNLSRLDLNLLVVFVHLWETRSVTRTSERLSLTQSAVSHALKRLRLALDDELFMQNRAGLRPTAYAQDLVVPVMKALEDIESALSTTSTFDPATARRDFQIAMNEAMELSISPALVDGILSEAPGILLNLLPMPEMRAASMMLESGELQLLLSTREIQGPGLVSEVLAEIPLVAMLSDRIPVRGKTIPMNTYLSIPHVVIRPVDHRGSIIDRSLAKQGLKRPISAVVQNFMVMAAVGARCGYICNVPSMVAEQFGAQLGLKTYALPVDIAPLPLIVTYHERFKSDSSVAWLVRKTSEILRKWPKAAVKR